MPYKMLETSAIMLHYCNLRKAWLQQVLYQLCNMPILCNVRIIDNRRTSNRVDQNSIYQAIPVRAIYLGEPYGQNY
jgi:hypothetical protein